MTQQRHMIHRGERRPLAAGAHVAAAEIMHHVDAEFAGHQGAVAELAGTARLPALARPCRCGRPMQHGLAVEPDHLDVGRRELVVVEEAPDRGCLGQRQRRAGLLEYRGFRTFELPGAGGIDGALDQRAQLGRVGSQCPGTELGNGLAVAAYQRDVDMTVEHGPRHQSDRPSSGHAAPSRHGPAGSRGPRASKNPHRQAKLQ